MRISASIALAMSVAIMMTSCSEEQSSFNIDSVPGRGVIEGTVLYNQGTKLVDGKFVYDYKPAANLKMVAVVTNSDYDSNLSGQTTYEVTTDENGKYSITLPAPTVKEVSVRFITSSFRGVRSVVKIENNKVVTVEEPVVYTGMGETSVRANGIKYCNFNCTETSEDLLSKGFTEYANVSGRLGQNVEKYTAGKTQTNDAGVIIGHTDATLEYLFKGAANTPLILEVEYQNHTFVYNTTSNASGGFTMQVPVAAFPASFSCKVSAVPYNGNFTQYERVIKEVKSSNGRTYEYIDYTPHTLNGYYSQQIPSTTNLSFPVSGVTGRIEAKAMIFSLIDDTADDFGYSPYRWNTSSDWND